jgi:alcohol dehydrogenase class IV
VEWNSEDVNGAYRGVYSGALPERLRRLAEKAGLPASLREAGVPEEALPRLAEEAGAQWFGRFNPRPFDAEGALEIYEMAR